MSVTVAVRCVVFVWIAVCGPVVSVSVDVGGGFGGVVFVAYGTVFAVDVFVSGMFVEEVFGVFGVLDVVGMFVVSGTVVSVLVAIVAV